MPNRHDDTHENIQESLAIREYTIRRQSEVPHQLVQIGNIDAQEIPQTTGRCMRLSADVARGIQKPAFHVYGASLPSWPNRRER